MARRRKRIINVGIIGLGRTGWKNHALRFEVIPDLYRVAAVCDRIPERMEEAKERFDCATYKTYNALLADKNVDLVVIALPNKPHANYSIKALKAGKHVVCDKPMATSLKDADRMLRAAKSAKGVFTIFQNRRYWPDAMKVKEIMDSGRLGRITMIKMCAHGFSRRWDWQTLRKHGGGSLNNTGPHYVDLALQFLGNRYPTELFVQMENTLSCGDAEDHVKLIMRAPNAPVVEVEVMSDVAYPRPLWLITGTEGGLSGSATELRWKWMITSRLKKREVDEAPTPDRSYNSEKLPMSKERVWTWPKNVVPAQVLYYQDLHKALMKGAPPPVNPVNIRRQIKLIEECHKRCRI